MPRELMVASLLLWGLLAVEPLTPTAAQAQEVALTLRTDQATYPVGSEAGVTLTLDATTAMTVAIGYEVLGCDWNVVMLEPTGAEVFNAREESLREGFECPAIAAFVKVPPSLVKQATIPLHNNLQAGDPLPPGRYTVRGLLRW